MPHAINKKHLKTVNILNKSAYLIRMIAIITELNTNVACMQSCVCIEEHSKMSIVIHQFVFHLLKASVIKSSHKL